MDEFTKGIKEAQKYKIAICSIVRDCEKSLRKNIPVIEKIRPYFKSSVVIVFENDSVDGTKEILTKWAETHEDVYVELTNNMTKTIPSATVNGVNKYFSEARISKMASYRNHYLEKLEELNFNPDFVIVVDLDVAKIFPEGILTSFSMTEDWDVLCSNGYSLSPTLKRRYHDSYALVELGKEQKPQTEASIRECSEKWSFLKQGMPLIPVYSAYGGLSVYRYEAIKNLRYQVIKNNDPRVESRCEHFSMCHDIRDKGFTRIYINPNMTIKYQSLDLKLIRKFLTEKLKNRFRTLTA